MCVQNQATGLGLHTPDKPPTTALPWMLQWPPLSPISLFLTFFRLQCTLSRAAKPNFTSPATSLLGPQSSRAGGSKSTFVSRFHKGLGTWRRRHPSLLRFFLLKPHRPLLCTNHPSTSGPLHRPRCSSILCRARPLLLFRSLLK